MRVYVGLGSETKNLWNVHVICCNSNQRLQFFSGLKSGWSWVLVWKLGYRGSWFENWGCHRCYKFNRWRHITQVWGIILGDFDLIIIYKFVYFWKVATFGKCTYLILLYIIGYDISQTPHDPDDPHPKISGGRDIPKPKPPRIAPPTCMTSISPVIGLIRRLAHMPLTSVTHVRTRTKRKAEICWPIDGVQPNVTRIFVDCGQSASTINHLHNILKIEKPTN